MRPFDERTGVSCDRRRRHRRADAPPGVPERRPGGGPPPGIDHVLGHTGRVQQHGAGRERHGHALPADRGRSWADESVSGDDLRARHGRHGPHGVPPDRRRQVHGRRADLRGTPKGRCPLCPGPGPLRGGRPRGGRVRGGVGARRRPVLRSRGVVERRRDPRQRERPRVPRRGPCNEYDPGGLGPPGRSVEGNPGTSGRLLLARRGRDLDRSGGPLPERDHGRAAAGGRGLGRRRRGVPDGRRECSTARRDRVPRWRSHLG